MSISWNTGLAAERARAKNKSEPPADKKLIKKLHDKWCRANGYKPQASSTKQAPSLTEGPGDDRMNLERNKYEQ